MRLTSAPLRLRARARPSRGGGLRCLWRAQEGIAALEFALSASVLMLLALSGIEVTRFLIIEQKVDEVAATMADLVAQSTTLTKASLSQMMTAAGQIIQPEANDFAAQGTVIITSVYQNGTGTAPTVQWNYSGGGTLSRTSKIGTVGGNATLPGGLVLNDKDNVIVAEVYYHYTPILSVSAGLLSPQDIYRTTVYKPRLGALTTPPS